MLEIRGSWDQGQVGSGEGGIMGRQRSGEGGDLRFSRRLTFSDSLCFSSFFFF